MDIELYKKRDYVDPLLKFVPTTFQKDPDDNPFESTTSMQRIYKELYEEFVSGLKTEKFKLPTKDSDD
jgi:hypothetical protein